VRAFDEPRTSQTVSRFQSAYSKMPICGCSVVNGYRDFRPRLEMAVSKVYCRVG